MADRNGTLVADTVASVDVQAERIEVVNRDGTDEIWVCVGGDTPTVGDQDTNVFCLLPMSARVFYEDISGNDKTQTVKLISSGTPAYSVQPL